MNERIIRVVLGLMIGVIGMGGLQAQEVDTHKKCLTLELREQYTRIYPEILENKARNQALKTDSIPDSLDFTYVIPVVFHVMYETGGPELAIGLPEVEEQIAIMNEDFGRYGDGFNTHPDGIDSKIRFCLAKIDPEGNPTDGLDYVYYPPTANINPFNISEDTLMKRTQQWDPYRYLNIYIVRMIYNNQLYGYAFYPDEVAGTIYDGVVIGYRFIGNQPGGVYGRTATHESGHYLNLLHTWGDGDCSVDDEVEDTPLCSQALYTSPPNCPAPTQCGGLRQVENYMDYSRDACMNMFSKGQVERMRNAIYLYRWELVSKENLKLTGCGEYLDTVPATEAFYIYPNPAFERVMVYSDFTNEEFTELRLVSPDGKVLFRQENPDFAKGPIPINLEGQQKGLYHVVIQSPSRYLRKTVAVLN